MEPMPPPPPAGPTPPEPPPPSPPPAAPPPGDDLPVRLVVRGDLRRSRLTVLLRLLLALPHVVWWFLWSLVVVLLAFPAWLVALFDGQLPGVFHRFFSSYVRYGVHVLAYVLLAANRFPGFTGRPGYEVDLEIAPPVAQNQLTILVRLVLALPAFVLAGVLLGGGSNSNASVAVAAAFLGWFAALALGRMPRGLRDVVAYAIGYGAQVAAYTLLLTDRYPSTDPRRAPLEPLPPHPVRLAIRDELRRSRLTVFFRLLLLLPHIVWLALWAAVVLVALPFGWLLALVLGRLPRPLARFDAAFLRYTAHVGAFAQLVGGPFPGFTGADYPIELTIEPAGKQRRLTILFRLALALPALLVSTAYSSALVVVAVFGWVVSLLTGRMPEGLRNLGAVAIRYDTQAYAYLFLVTDRYPFASPSLETSRPEGAD